MSISTIARATALDTLHHTLFLSCRWAGQATVINWLAHQNINRWLVTATVPFFRLLPLSVRTLVPPLLSLRQVVAMTVQEEIDHVATQWKTNFAAYPLRQTSRQMRNFFAFDLFYLFTLTFSNEISHHRYSPLHDLPEKFKPSAQLALRFFICMVIFPLPVLLCVSVQKAHLAAQKIVMALFLQKVLPYILPTQA